MGFLNWKLLRKLWFTGRPNILICSQQIFADIEEISMLLGRPQRRGKSKKKKKKKTKRKIGYILDMMSTDDC